MYSGPVAASAYQRSAPAAAPIRAVCPLGPSQRVAFRRQALCPAAHCTTPLGGKGTFSANGASWASATVSTLSGYKYFGSEGGLRVPLIIAGAPGQVGGQLSKTFTRVNDLVPTLLEAAGIPAHDGNYQGRQVEPMDGRSLLALLQGKAARVYGPSEAVGYELSGCQAVFKGAYKLIRNIPPLGDRQWHLYDLEKDPGEADDLAPTHPDIVTEMQTDYAA